MRAIARYLLVLCALTACLALPTQADARQSRKKAIWGPVTVDGKSQFPIYHDLGAGIYELTVRWNLVAPTRPHDPRDPTDPAYRWPPEVDYAIREARRYRIKVSLLLIGTPSWANGNRSRRWAPRKPGDFADFSEAAARRWP